MCLAATCLSMMFTIFVDPILAVGMKRNFGTTNEMVGLIFLFSSVTYIIGASLSSWMSGRMHRRYVILTAFLLMCIQNVLIGPSAILGLPNEEILVAAGVTMTGLCLCLVLVPTVSEIIEILERPNTYDPKDVSDQTSGLYNSMCNLGSLLCPLFAGGLNDLFGYRFTCDIVLISTVTFTLLFYFTMVFNKKLKKPIQVSHTD
jgi:MFS family permease